MNDEREARPEYRKWIEHIPEDAGKDSRAWLLTPADVIREYLKGCSCGWGCGECFRAAVKALLRSLVAYPSGRRRPIGISHSGLRTEMKDGHVVAWRVNDKGEWSERIIN